MKTLLKITLAFLVFLSVDTYAQETMIPDVKYDDLEKYISLARQNFPRKKAVDERRDGAKIAVTLNTLSYLDIFNASYFYRPQEKSVLDPINPYNVNGFQFGINVNLGNILQKPFLVKKAKSDYKLAQYEAQEYNTTLDIEVKKRYYDYIQQINLLKLSTQLASDNKNVAESLRTKFEKGEITLDAYNQSRITQFSSFQQKIQTETTFLKAKDALEEIIGTKLSEVK